MTAPPDAERRETPYALMGGDAMIRALVERFYDAMDAHEPALAALHAREDGKVSRGSRDRFASFLIGWLGGPDDYVRTHGHPRLRMRHGRVPVDTGMRDAWLRCMNMALEHDDVPAGVRGWLQARFAEVADFLRNSPG
jgi:hemoglobin